MGTLVLVPGGLACRWVDTTVFLSFGLLNTCYSSRHTEPRFVPWVACWLKGVRKTWSPAMGLLAWRRVLDRLTVDQVPADIVEEWLHAFQSAETLVRRQRGRIDARVPTVSVTQSTAVSEGGSTRAGDGEARTDDGDEGQRINVPVPERFRPSSSHHASKRGRGQ
ncbi:hypothetical protein RHMOL_Rhmol02G0179800 [Rhododendron molle]|uniref:Uncharacterized protein n=1 Tax=Rhododendron molle TaxID=49168 RepID=A0ACC0PSS8_RHOML|nr:hypothetical protein RHMOL_Rhmol02G0179800 [Rhododendron molle]